MEFNFKNVKSCAAPRVLHLRRQEMSALRVYTHLWNKCLIFFATVISLPGHWRPTTFLFIHFVPKHMIFQ